MRSVKLLIVDDSAFWCETAASYLERDGLEVVSAGTLAEAREHLVDPPHIVILDQQLPDGEGLSLAEEMMEARLDTRILMVTGFPELEDAVQALRLRIDDYLSKPVQLEVVRHAVLRSLESLRLERLDELQKRQSESERAKVRLVGDALAEVRSMIERLGAADCPVLITGPTGSGKSLAAKAVHYASGTDRPFVKLNCAAIPETLVESELFGVEKGAFTGATSSRPGLFELAHGGTLFLDEIGEMSLPVQAKLLGVLEDGEARRVGGSKPRRFDVRIVAATNVDLTRAVDEGTFRRDLFFRLNIGTLAMPALRDCRGDLEELVQALLEGLRAAPARLADGEIEALGAYPWPGNVRELKNVLERAVLLQDPAELRPSSLLPAQDARSTESAGGGLSSLAELEARHIERVLEHFDGNRKQTAEALGIDVSSLRRKLKKQRAD